MCKTSTIDLGNRPDGVYDAMDFLYRNKTDGIELNEDTTAAVIGGGNTAMDAARTARRLGGKVTIVYRRTQDEMPVRKEELHNALEEDIGLNVLRAPAEFFGNDKTHFVTEAKLDIMSLGEPDASGRRRPLATGE